MKEKYLEWSYKTGGYKRARKTFTRYTSNTAVLYGGAWKAEATSKNIYFALFLFKIIVLQIPKCYFQFIFKS